MLRAGTVVLAAAASVLAAGCAAEPYEASPPPEQQPPNSGAAFPPPTGSAIPGAPAPSAPSSPAVPPHAFHLSAASAALVSQAHAQAAGGNTPLALSTVERALRIEPDNPLLWIELGQIHEGSGNYAQADGMGRKALQLASGDPRAQSAAWRLIAESLRARGHNPQASDADARAEALQAH